MSWEEAIPGVLERLQSISGLTVHVGPPTTAHSFPLVYFYYSRGVIVPSNQLSAARYVVVIQVVVRWQDNTQSEYDLAPFVNSIPSVFDARTRDANGYSYATLGGRVNQSKIIDIRADGADGFPTIGETPLRGVVFDLEITDKPA